MKYVFVLATALLGLSACKRDRDSICPDNLVGTWTLVNRQCFCPRTPVPPESITFEEGGGYILLRDGQRTRGTYTFGTESRCNAGEPAVVLIADYSSLASSARYTITGCTLTLDYGGCLDAPIDTYERQ